MAVQCEQSHRERGSVVVTTALSMVVLLAFLGGVIDIGRIYVIKSELQNAADSCALAAAGALDGSLAGIQSAANAAKVVAEKNNLNLQNDALTVSTNVNPTGITLDVAF